MIYAHRTIPNLMVNDLTLKRKHTTESHPITVEINASTWPNTPDLQIKQTSAADWETETGQDPISIA